MVIDRRLKVADMTAQGMKPEEIKEELGYSSTASVYKAQAHPAVAEQIAWHRDNLFEQSRIDRVDLLRDLYESITCPTGPIFLTLRGEGELLLASNLDKLDDVQSRLIQQIEIEPTTVIDESVVDGEAVALKRTVSVVKKIRFHSPDAARKILSKAAGFEDGLPVKGEGEGGGPFRGMTIVPPIEMVEVESSETRPPGNPI